MDNTTPNDRQQAIAIGTALLDTTGRTLNHWSLGLAMAAILLIGIKPLAVYTCVAMAASLLAGLVQLYYALRCAFDAAVFARCGDNQEDYAAFDRVLAFWQMRGRPAKTLPPERRLYGALRLLLRQLYCFAAQVILVVVGLGLLLWRPYIL